MKHWPILSRNKNAQNHAEFYIKCPQCGWKEKARTPEDAEARRRSHIDNPPRR